MVDQLHETWLHTGLTVSKGYVAPAQKQGIDDQRFAALNGLIATNVRPPCNPFIQLL